jgi:hypothetical protein
MRSAVRSWRFCASRRCQGITNHQLVEPAS